MGKKKITLVRSVIGKPKSQKATVEALGLKRINHTVEVDADNPALMGMVKKIQHLLSIEEA